MNSICFKYLNINTSFRQGGIRYFHCTNFIFSNNNSNITDLGSETITQESLENKRKELLREIKHPTNFLFLGMLPEERTSNGDSIQRDLQFTSKSKIYRLKNLLGQLNELNNQIISDSLVAATNKKFAGKSKDLLVGQPDLSSNSSQQLADKRFTKGWVKGSIFLILGNVLKKIPI